MQLSGGHRHDLVIDDDVTHLLSGSGFRVQGSGCRVQGAGLRVEG